MHSVLIKGAVLIFGVYPLILAVAQSHSSNALSVIVVLLHHYDVIILL